MAGLTGVKDARGNIVKWDLSFSYGGKKGRIVFSTKRFDETDVKQARRLVEQVLEYRKRDEDLPPRLNDKLLAFPFLRDKLIEKGVVEGEKETTLKELWALYYASSKFKALAANTQENVDSAKKQSLAYFAEGAVIVDSIELEDAKGFSNWLDEKGNSKTGGGVSVATRASAIKNLKTLFNWGAENGHIKENNPFLKLKRGSFVNRKRLNYISDEDARKMLDACSSQEWRVLIALARWGGLRVPSEIIGLTWGAVDFDPKFGALTVYDRKRKQERTFPLFPQIRKELEALKKERGAVDSCDLIFGGRRLDSNLRTTLEKIRKRAGVPDYGKPWQNLRASAATDICNNFGAICEAEWVGHSQAVSMKHYLQTRKSDFLAANQGTVDDET